MPQYKMETGNLEAMEKKLNTLGQQGWKPILMSTVEPHAQASVTVTVIFEKVTS